MEGMPLAQAEGTDGSPDRLPMGGQRPGGGEDWWRCPPTSPIGGRLEAEGDEELTSLDWLHEGKNLLGGMRLAGVTSVDPLPALAGPEESHCPLSVAVEDASLRHLPVKEIYKWILQQYPCLKRTPGDWKKSMRHNRSFRRALEHGREALGKGSFWSIDTESVSGLLQAIRKRSPSLSTTDLQNPCYNQRTDGRGQEQLPVSGLDSNTSALSPDATDTTSSGEHAQTNSCDPASRPVWSDVCLARRPASVSNGDHNYSLAGGGGERHLRVAAPDRTVPARGGGDDGSEGFVSGGESGTEDEGAEDSLADSGYVPLGTRTPSTAGSGPRLEGWDALGIDEELREVAGSLLNLAGIHR
ncbi:forkhead box protein N2-like isoform X2 [Amblyraja radiata]|uniref:forkhead box protein N2-like isoform X2 n=1 Tax=Amblyraja radiata TaxID=386614 RepID=UPI001402E948|nr:forkhead box protein N2-like isoform X2 [Amblyraja radiata]